MVNLQGKQPKRLQTPAEMRAPTTFSHCLNNEEYPFLQTGHYLNTALQVLIFLNNSDLILQNTPEEATLLSSGTLVSKIFPGKRKLAHN